MVGCVACANLCPVKVISFAEANDTSRDKAQRLVKNFQLIPKVKEELERCRDDLLFA